jgi:hypothetical protein
VYLSIYFIRLEDAQYGSHHDDQVRACNEGSAIKIVFCFEFHVVICTSSNIARTYMRIILQFWFRAFSLKITVCLKAREVQRSCGPPKAVAGEVMAPGPSTGRSRVYAHIWRRGQQQSLICAKTTRKTQHEIARRGSWWPANKTIHGGSFLRKKYCAHTVQYGTRVWGLMRDGWTIRRQRNTQHCVWHTICCWCYILTIILFGGHRSCWPAPWLTWAPAPAAEANAFRRGEPHQL